MKEHWKDIEGYGGRYQVSDLGRVKSRRRGWRILKQSANCNRQIVGLSENGNRTNHLVSHLVAVAFIGAPPPGKYKIRHLDGDRGNNAARNIKWVPHTGEDNNNARLTEADVCEIRRLADAMPAKELSEIFNTSRRNIAHIIRRKRWHHI